MNDFRRRFFSQVRLFPWCGGKSFPSSLRVSEKRTKKRAVSREKKATAGVSFLFVRRRLRFFFVFIKEEEEEEKVASKMIEETARERKGTFIQSQRRSRSLSRERGIRI